MKNQDREALTAEAADIFLRLREDPADPERQAERDAFLAGGAPQRDIYAQVTRVWQGTGAPPRRRIRLPAVVFGLVLGLSALALADPARKFLLADVSTRHEGRQVALASGDIAVLDADTALADTSEGDTRQVALLDGAALFDVAQDGRGFVVAVGDLTVEVLGTTFETAMIGDAVAVGVREGRVRVSGGGREWTLGAGDRLLRSADGTVEIATITPEDVAPWVQGRFVADGLTFAQVADVIDRRLQGRVMLRSADLAASRVSGTINLDDPDLALQALAATRGARIISIPVLGKIILP